MTGVDPSRFWASVRESAPDTPVSSKPVEVMVVARRCVYINDYRIAGGKPYFSENLPSHTLSTTLGELLDAFTERQVKTALAEKKAVRRHYAAAHAAIATEARRAETPQDGSVHEGAAPTGIAQ